jgi:hypothetical protein
MFRRQALRNALSFRVWIAFAVLLLEGPTPTWAHREPTAHEAPVGGISIPNITHGQMAIMAAHKAAILDLAARQMPTDPTMRRLESFINLQFFACMWGKIRQRLGIVPELNSRPAAVCSTSALRELWLWQSERR